MSSRTGTKTGTAESPMAIHHLVTVGFTSKNIQTIDKMYHTITAVSYTHLDNNKPMLTVMISEDLVKAGQNAGKLVREAAKLLQGGGGGQPHFATAGRKNADGLNAAVDKVIELPAL